MKKALPILVVILGIIFVVGAWLVGIFNTMVTKQETVNNAQAEVEVQLQRRFDLIPNLVESTKGFLLQEQKVYSDIAEARTRYSGAPTGSPEKLEAANELESALGRLLVIIENYPTLKSDQTVRSLMDELAGTENRISVARNKYNETVTDYNIYIKRFPNVLFANIMGYKEAILFKSVEGAETAPKVDLTL